MSAPPLSVVPCTVYQSAKLGPRVIDHPARFFGGGHSSDVSALAVPDALWMDKDFRNATQRRLEDLIGAWVRGGERRGVCPSFHDAIFAELRARAGGQA